MNEERKKALQSLKTARGQIDGIVKMIEDDGIVWIFLIKFLPHKPY